MQKEENTLRVTELHPSFGAEVNGVDLRDMSADVFTRLLAIIAKASRTTNLPADDASVDT